MFPAPNTHTLRSAEQLTTCSRLMIRSLEWIIGVHCRIYCDNVRLGMRAPPAYAVTDADGLSRAQRWSSPHALLFNAFNLLQATTSEPSVYDVVIFNAFLQAFW